MKHSMKEKERIINNYMKKLDISREEAESLYSFDFEGAEEETSKILTEKAKKNLKSFYVVSDANTQRHRKHTEDPDKTSILSMCETALKNNSALIKEVTPEKTIDFTYNGTPYNFKLTKHNSYKGIRESKATKRKIDIQKAEILAWIKSSLETDPSINTILVQTETAINFNKAETNYTLALTKTRVK